VFKSKKKIIVFLVILIIAGFGTWYFMNNRQKEEPTQTQTVDVSSQSSKNLSEIISATDEYSTFNDSLTASGLVETLQGAGPFTVLAPNDKAFEKLPEETLNNLLLPENVELLKGLINYHIIASKLMSSDLTDGQRIPTVNGSELTVRLSDGNVSFIDSKGSTSLVVSANIEGSNGVIHELDSVLIPQ
jgi:uncharacterized surface protein with fasciclin (FAS1) repeats